jgi:hypothetical protein
MTEKEFAAEVKEWRRVHTFGGYVWPEPNAPAKVRALRASQIKPAGLSLERVFEIADRALRRTA